MMRENKKGIGIVPMEDVKVKAWSLDDNGKTSSIKQTLIKTHTVIRVGIEYIHRADQILTTEEVRFKAMVPDAHENLVLTDFTLDAKTGVKIGTIKLDESNTDPKAVTTPETTKQ